MSICDASQPVLQQVLKKILLAKKKLYKMIANKLQKEMKKTIKDQYTDKDIKLCFFLFFKTCSYKFGLSSMTLARLGVALCVSMISVVVDFVESMDLCFE